MGGTRAFVIFMISILLANLNSMAPGCIHQHINIHLHSFPVSSGVQLRPCGGLEIVAGGQRTTHFDAFFIAEQNLNRIPGGPGRDGIPHHIDHVRVLHEPR